MLEAMFPKGLSFDCLLGGRVELAQPVGGYRVAVDPVLLAAALPARPGERLADLGCGSGAVSLCLAARLTECRIIALEREQDLAALAAANIAANGCGARVQVAVGDVAGPPLAAASFDHVAMNPPYLSRGAGGPPANRLRRVAAVEGGATLRHWIATAMALLRSGGSIALVHRADRLDEIVALLTRHQTGGLSVLPLWPKEGVPARRVLVRCRKGDRSPFQLLAGLALHDAAGRFTAAAERVLRDGAALPVPIGGRPRRPAPNPVAGQHP